MMHEQQLPREKFGRLYQGIAASIESASADLQALEITHEEGRKNRQDVLTVLHEAGQRFRDELSLLERHAEWERLTVAFFGETNAGKSTIIEALRILLDEESRRAELASAKHDLAAFESRLAEQAACVVAAMELAEQEQERLRRDFIQAQDETLRRFKQGLSEAVRSFEDRQLDAAGDIQGKVRAISKIVERENAHRIKVRLWRARVLFSLLGTCLGALAMFVLRG